MRKTLPPLTRPIIRPARVSDAAPLSDLLNEIIALGGTTAYEHPLTPDKFQSTFLEGPDFICCFVAEDADGAVAGFQSLEHRPRIPDDWGDIATFTRVGGTARGIGTALFARTLEFAHSAQLVGINAVIRADNSSGLRYYSKMGFEDYAVAKAIPLSDGTPVDRTTKRYFLR